VDSTYSVASESVPRHSQPETLITS